MPKYFQMTFVCAAVSRHPQISDDEEVETDDVLTYGGHATQILWKSTTELGCAVESCTLNGVPFEVLVCHYNPA